MTDQEYVNSLIAKGRKAIEGVAAYTQEQADAMVKAIGKAVYDNAELISEEAAAETGMGTKEDKIVKHTDCISMNWGYLRGKPSVGVLEVDKPNNLVVMAKPMGVICCATPSTNPTTTAVFDAMICLKGLNAVIIAPHPRAQHCSMHCVQLMRDALAKLGAPVDLVQCLENPTIAMSGILMGSADATIAVGSAGMVRAAYSHGKPAFGVGQGNVQCIMDRDYPDYETAVAYVLGNRAFDDGIPCTGEQTLYIPKEKEEEILAICSETGAYVLEDEDEINILRESFFDANGINRDIVGQSPKNACAAVGVEIPECSVLMVPLRHGTGKSEILCREILFPIIRFVTYDRFEDAVAMAKANLLLEGAGHSSSIWSKNQDHINYMALQLPVARIMVEQGNGDAGGNTWFNGLPPTLAIGCGTWGGTSISENLTYYHLLNKTKVSYTIPDAHVPSEEELWG